jgi:hypothetical protein
MPKILAGFSILFGGVLAARARESRPFIQLDWADFRHAALVVAITALAASAYDWLGFLTTMVLLMFALLVVIERRHIVPAGAYSLGVVLITYVTFEYLLKTPLNTGPFGF